MHIPYSELIGPAVNFTILVVALVYFLKTPIKGFVKTRAETVSSDLFKAEKQIKEAKDNFEKLSRKMDTIELEIESIKSESVKHARDVSTEMIVQANKLSDGIRKESKLTANALASDFKSKVTNEIGLRVLEKTEAHLRKRLAAEDRARIRSDFIEKAGRMS